MPSSRVARKAKVFRPGDLALMSRVLGQCVTAADGPDERDDRAMAIMALFSFGVTDEAALVSMVSTRPSKRS